MSPANSKRPWCQYRLSTLFLVTSLASLPLGMHAFRERQYQMRLKAVEILENAGDSVEVGKAGTPSEYWDPGPAEPRLGRDEYVRFVRAGPVLSDEEVSAIVSFPTLRGLDLNGGLDVHVHEVPEPELGVFDRQLREIGKLRQIEYLDLSETGVTDAGLAHLSEMSSLRELHLHGTTVTGSGLSALTGLESLETLHLGGARLSADGVACLGALASLRELILIATRIHGTNLAQLGTLRSLSRLSLDSSDISDDDICCLPPLPSLRHLSLCNTNITDRASLHLSAITNIDTLFLAGNDMGDKSLPNVARLRQLRSLSLGETHVTDDGLSALRSLPALEHLDLSGCAAISDAALVSLAPMKALRYVYANDTLVSAIGVARLKMLNGQIKVHWNGAGKR